MFKALLLALLFLLLSASARAETAIENAFSPQQGATDLVVKTIGEAQHSVRVAAYFLPHGRLPRLWSKRIGAGSM